MDPAEPTHLLQGEGGCQLGVQVGGGANWGGVSGSGLRGEWSQVQVQIRIHRRKRKMGSRLEIRARGEGES